MILTYKVSFYKAEANYGKRITSGLGFETLSRSLMNLN